jgi:hypothetical protein
MNNESEMIRKEVVMASPGTKNFAGGTEKNTRNLKHDSQCLDRETNQTSSEQKACDPCFVRMFQWSPVINPRTSRMRALHRPILFVAVFLLWFILYSLLLSRSFINSSHFLPYFISLSSCHFINRSLCLLKTDESAFSSYSSVDYEMQ